jgi:protein gp37
MSKIEWCDLTWNISTGCTKVSAGCQNCYAERMHRRQQGIGHWKYMNSFNKPAFHSSELNRVFPKKRKRIFINSMSDLFHDDISDEMITSVFHQINWRREHIFMILTKRPIRLVEFSKKYVSWSTGELPSNLWLGVTVEDERNLWRIDQLRKVPAAVRFVSFEPLLERIQFPDFDLIDWIIVGSETGPGARKMFLDWAINLSAQAEILNIPFFFKKPSKGDFTVHIPSLNVRQFPADKD